MVQIKCLGNGLYSLKNSHIPFGMGFQPPPLRQNSVWTALVSHGVFPNHSVYYVAFANTTHCVLWSVCSSHKRLCWPQPNHNTLNMHHCNHSVHNITQCVQYHSVQEPHYHSVTVYYSRPNTCTLIWSQHLPSAPPLQKSGHIIFWGKNQQEGDKGWRWR